MQHNDIKKENEQLSELVGTIDGSTVKASEDLIKSNSIKKVRVFGEVQNKSSKNEEVKSKFLEGAKKIQESSILGEAGQNVD